MLKLLTKYKMWILVTFGIFVIISFLLADSLQRLGRSAQLNTTRFTIGPDKVTQVDEVVASTGIEAINRALGRDQQGRSMLNRALALPEDAKLPAWLMRTTEARRAGLLGGSVDGRAMALELARASYESDQNRTRGQQWREAMKGELNLTDEQVSARVRTEIAQIAENMLAMATVNQPTRVEGTEAFAQLRGLIRQNQLYQDIARLSAPRLLTEARKMDEAIVDYMFIPVDPARAAASPAPTEDEINAHFEKFKGTLAGKGDYGMGYRQPDRVSFVRLTIDRAKIAAKVSIDPVNVQKKLTSEGPRADESPSDARRRVEAELRESTTDRVVRDAAGGVRAEFLRVIGTWSETAGYRVIPEGFDRTKLEFATIAKTVAMRVGEQTGVLIDPLAVFTQEAPVSRDELSKQLGDTFSFSVAFRGQQIVPALNVLFEARELNAAAPAADDQMANMGRGMIAAQVGVPVVDGFELPTRPDARGVGTQHFVMVTRAVPSAVPTSVEEVRSVVVEDVKKVRAIEALRAQVEEVLPAASALGMGEAVNLLRTRGISTELRTGASVSQMRGLLGPDRKPDTNAGSKEVVEAIMAQARRLDPTVRFDATSVMDRTFLLVPAGRLGVVLGQIEQFRPVSREQFQLLAPMVERSSAREQLGESLAAHFSAEALIERLAVKGLDAKSINREGDGK